MGTHWEHLYPKYAKQIVFPPPQRKKELGFMGAMLHNLIGLN